MTFLILCAVFLLCSQTLCQEAQALTCNETVPSNSSFTLEKFQGKWYEIGRSGRQKNCTRDEIHFYDNSTHRSNATRVCSKDNTTTAFIIQQPNVTSPHVHLLFDNKTVFAQVLDTDYSNYSVFWLCNSTTPNEIVVLSKNASTTLAQLNHTLESALNRTTQKFDIKQNYHSADVCSDSKGSGSHLPVTAFANLVVITLVIKLL